MSITFIIILILAFSGFALTYFFADEEGFLWRISAGNIIGSAIFGTIGFFFANFFGLSSATAFVSLVVSLSPLALYARKDLRSKFARDWAEAKNKFNNANSKRVFNFFYYFLFFVLFWIFFDRAMFETAQGIFTGGSQNLGDLPFHLGAIFSFTDGQNFPPQNPSFAGAKFTYPFVADFITACFMKFGATVENAMHLQNVSWAFSLLVILQKFVFKMTKSEKAGKIAPAVLFFSGGLGFLWFFKDFWQQGKDFLDFINNLPGDYTISEKFRWGNSLVTLFLTQRSLLLGMPLTILVLQKLWEIFSGENALIEKSEKESEAIGNKKSFSGSEFPISVFLVGLLAGSLPLIHLHSLFVLFIVGVFLLILKPERWREWIAFGVGTGVIAAVELAWAMTGTATETGKFIAYNFGWDARDLNVFWFWLKNTGLFIPLLVFGLILSLNFRSESKESKIENQKPETENREDSSPLVFHRSSLLKFYLPFLFCFVIANVMKLAPWEWDNIKVLIYWFVGSLPFVAFALAWIYKRNIFFKIVAAGCLIVLTFSGVLDVWRTVSGQINYKVFDADAVKVAEQIKAKTAPDALFLNAPTYNSAIVLTGRRSLMRFTGHLSSHGIDYAEREADLRRIYEGNATADILLRKYDVEYVLISPEEKNGLAINEDYFRKYPVIAESGQYRVYKIK